VIELLLRFFVYRGRFFRDPWRVDSKSRLTNDLG